MHRAATWLIGSGGLVLAALMAYTLLLDVGASAPPLRAGVSAGAAQVAVIFPDRSFWTGFRQGALACARRGLARLVEEGDDAVLLETPRRRRRVRLAFHEARGLRETRDVALQLVARRDAPIALVGSSNTVLTAALAEALRNAPGNAARPGPVLLIPRATAVLVERPDTGDGPKALLDIDPGRTFRFCPNNRRLAELVVRCLVDRDAGATPRRAYLIEDRHDPYSADLADCFRRAIERAAPDAELIERADTVEYTGIAAVDAPPGCSEEALAEAIWREAEAEAEVDGHGRTTWVVLPLEEQPAGRLLRALGRHRRNVGAAGGGPLRVLCGEAIGREALARWAGKLPFPVWCVSFDSPPGTAPRHPPGAGEALPAEVHVPAEVVSALVRCLDLPAIRPLTVNALRDALSALEIGSGDPSAFGRSLAFDGAGERRGEDLGHVLMVDPERGEVLALTRGATGRWCAPEPTRGSASPVARPLPGTPPVPPPVADEGRP